MPLRSVSWKKVFDRTVELCGLVPGEVTLEEREFLKGAIAQRTRWAWEHFWWPELMRTQERRYRDTFAAGSSYEEGAEVYFAPPEGYYRRLLPGSGEDPTHPAVWEPLSEIDAHIALDQAGRDRIGEVRRVTRRNPRMARTPGELPFSLNENGVQLEGEVPPSVWVDFRLPAEDFDGDDHDEDQSYEAGDRLYADALGDFFDVLTPGSGLDPADPAVGRRVRFPAVLEPFVTRAAYADWLRSDGQTDKAGQEERAAERFLDREVDKVAGQQGQTQRYSVRGAR